jgi:hypothetical protein
MPKNSTSIVTMVLLLLTSAGSAAGAEPVDGCEPFAEFDSAVFAPPTEIDNRFFPLRPGMQFTFVGQAGLGDEEVRILPRIVVFTVTDMIKVIDGVETLVIWDQDFAVDEEGEQFLVEEQLAFRSGRRPQCLDYAHLAKAGILVDRPSSAGRGR